MEYMVKKKNENTPVPLTGTKAPMADPVTVKVPSNQRVKKKEKEKR